MKMEYVQSNSKRPILIIFIYIEYGFIHGLENRIVRLHLFIQNHTYYQFETHYKSFTAENLSTNDSFPMIYVSAQSF